MKRPIIGNRYVYWPTLFDTAYYGSRYAGSIVRAIGVPGMRGRAPAPFQHVETTDGAILMVQRASLKRLGR